MLPPLELLEHDGARGAVRWHAVAVPVCCERQGAAVHAADDALAPGWFTVDQLPAPAAIDGDIANFYNCRRLHSSLGYVGPVAFELRASQNPAQSTRPPKRGSPT